MSTAVATATTNVRAQRLATVRAIRDLADSLHLCPCPVLLPYPGAGPTAHAEPSGG